MEIKIEAKSFVDAKDKLFKTYPELTDLDIQDFTESGDSIIFSVDDTKVKVQFNKEIDDLIKTEQFSDSDIAFICSDGKVHTPKGSTLFHRMQNMLSEGIVPIVGFTNFIDATNKLDEISIGEIPVVMNNLILTKEGNLLKGTLCRRINSVIKDNVVLVIDSNDASAVLDALSYLSTKPKVIGNSVIYSISEFELSDVQTIIDKLSLVPGIIRFKLGFSNLTLTGSINNG